MLQQLANYSESLTKIAALFAVLYGVYRWGRELYRKQGEKLAGKWTNEGDIILSTGSHSVHMELQLDGHNVGGTVQAFFQDGHSPLASIIGRRYGPFIRAKIVHVRHGDIHPLGKLCLRLHGKFMLFRCTDIIGDFYPRHTKLWRSNVV